MAKEIDMFPRDLIDETIKAFSVNATSATGYACVIQFVSRFNW